MNTFSSAPLNSGLPTHFLRPRLRGLYVVTDERFGGGHLAIARTALCGGASIIQLRDKTTPLRHLLPIAVELRRITCDYKALLLINDRIDVALLCRSDGVHLGPDDCPVEAARRVLGPHVLIGASCGDVQEARRAQDAGADYIGAGAVLGTATKGDAGAPIGLDGLRKIVQATHLPVAAIGGLSRATVGATIEAGASMACVVSAIARAGDEDAMQNATRELIAAARFH